MVFTRLRRSVALWICPELSPAQGENKSDADARWKDALPAKARLDAADGGLDLDVFRRWFEGERAQPAGSINDARNKLADDDRRPSVVFPEVFKAFAVGAAERVKARYPAEKDKEPFIDPELARAQSEIARHSRIERAKEILQIARGVDQDGLAGGPDLDLDRLAERLALLLWGEF